MLPGAAANRKHCERLWVEHLPNNPACLPPSSFTTCSQGVQLTYAEVKSLLLSSTDPSPPHSAGATQTGGRLNVGSAMAALALLLHERGEGQLPGGFLADTSAAEQLQQKMLQSSWGQSLLLGAAPDGASSQPAPLPGVGNTAASHQGGQEAQAQGQQASAQAMSADEAAARAPAQPARAARRRQLRAGRPSLS